MPVKLFFYILSSLFFLNFSISPLQKKEKEDINGPVKSIIESIYKTKNNLNQIEKGDFYSQEIHKYDQQGNKIESRKIDSNGLLTLKIKHLYGDSKGQVIESHYYAP